MRQVQMAWVSAIILEVPGKQISSALAQCYTNVYNAATTLNQCYSQKQTVHQNERSTEVNFSIRQGF